VNRRNVGGPGVGTTMLTVATSTEVSFEKCRRLANDSDVVASTPNMMPRWTAILWR
jgi:hypothetical protein